MLTWEEVEKARAFLREKRMKSWKTIRETQHKDRELPSVRELPIERELPPKRLEQTEFPEITEPIDDREAFIRHKESMRKRWFEYYKKEHSQENKLKLIDQYNFLAQSRQR